MQAKKQLPNLIQATAIATVPLAFEDRKAIEEWALANSANVEFRPSMDRAWRYTGSIDVMEGSGEAETSGENVYLLIASSRDGNESIEAHRIGIVTWSFNTATAAAELPAAAVSGTPRWVPTGISVADDNRLEELVNEPIRFTSATPASFTLEDVGQAVGVLRVGKVQADPPAGPDEFWHWQNGYWWR